MTVRVAITGAGGFLGWHLQVGLQASGFSVSAIDRSTFNDDEACIAALQGADLIVHAAGVNRAVDEAAILHENLGLAQRLVDLMDRCEAMDAPVVFTNSVHSLNDSTYGRAKRDSAEILRSRQQRCGGRFLDLILPHLFGEFGRPHYNSAVATFSWSLANGESVEVNPDGQLELLHCQEVAGAIAGYVSAIESGAPAVDSLRLDGLRCSVPEVWELLRGHYERYVTEGVLPAFDTPFELALFNVLRADLWRTGHYPVELRLHADHRGAFFEACRSDGTGQTSISTTEPQITRGDHYHFDKIERFVVVEGTARISLRRLLSDETSTYVVSGDQPVVIDMPTLVTHNITNVGDGTLVTLFWAGDHFDPAAPDTFPEAVFTS